MEKSIAPSHEKYSRVIHIIPIQIKVLKFTSYALKPCSWLFIQKFICRTSIIFQNSCRGAREYIRCEKFWMSSKQTEYAELKPALEGKWSCYRTDWPKWDRPLELNWSLRFSDKNFFALSQTVLHSHFIAFGKEKVY